LCLSVLFKTLDAFWFSLSHEQGQIEESGLLDD
jgi:hypothetical protein